MSVSRRRFLGQVGVGSAAFGLVGTGAPGQNTATEASEAPVATPARSTEAFTVIEVDSAAIRDRLLADGIPRDRITVVSEGVDVERIVHVEAVGAEIDAEPAVVGEHVAEDLHALARQRVEQIGRAHV